MATSDRNDPSDPNRRTDVNDPNRRVEPGDPGRPPRAAATTINEHHHHPENDGNRGDNDAAMAVGRGVKSVSWGAIFAGSIIALALMFMFSLLGVGIGAGAVDPAQDQQPLKGVGLGTGIYSIVAQLLSLAIGAFAAGRLAANPLKLNSGLHGVAVWALATLGMLYIATTAVGSIVGGAVGAVSSAGQAAADAAGSALPNNLPAGTNRQAGSAEVGSGCDGQARPDRQEHSG